MKITLCKMCGNKINSNAQKFCCYKCYHKSLIGIPTNLFWELASEDQKLNRIKKYFEKKVIKNENGCWQWKGTLNRRGYGFISIGIKKMAPAHRVSWIIHNGPIPQGLLVCHTCDVKSCTRPSHLFLGTTKDNALDRKIKNRNGNQNGELNSRAILNTEKVLEIKKLISQNISYNKIIELYNISKSTISSIKYNRIWRHLNVKS